MFKRPQLLTGDVAPTIFRLAWPMLFGILAMMAFNLVDSYFIGKLGKDELAAMGFIFPVIMIINNFALGIAIGTSSSISRAIGRGDKHLIQRLTTDALMLGAVFVSIIIVIGMLTIKPLFTMLGAQGIVLEHISAYMRIWYPGVIFVIVPMIGNNALRATGDTKTPGLIMIIVVTINAVLDPFLIFGIGPFPEMGITGAAVATVGTRMTAMIIALLVLHFREKMITFEKPARGEIIRSWSSILYIGIPAAAANIIIPISLAFITRLVAEYGNTAIAAYNGIGTRIEMFALTPCIALGAIIIPFIGQNMGAKKYTRIKQALNTVHLFSLLWGIFVFIVFIFFKQPIVEVFTDNPDIIHYAMWYLVIVAIGFGGYGVLYLSTSAFNALNKPFHAAGLLLMRLIIFIVPLSFLGAHYFGLWGIFAGTTLAGLLSGLIGRLWIMKTIAGHLQTEMQ